MDSGITEVIIYEVYDADGKYDSHHDEDDYDVAEGEARNLGGSVVSVTFNRGDADVVFTADAAEG